jgi:hypothetical protein
VNVSPSIIVSGASMIISISISVSQIINGIIPRGGTENSIFVGLNRVVHVATIPSTEIRM